MILQIHRKNSAHIPHSSNVFECSDLHFQRHCKTYNILQKRNGLASASLKRHLGLTDYSGSFITDYSRFFITDYSRFFITDYSRFFITDYSRSLITDYSSSASAQFYVKRYHHFYHRVKRCDYLRHIHQPQARNVLIISTVPTALSETIFGQAFWFYLSGGFLLTESIDLYLFIVQLFSS
jgi:hypothetical protein